ncbi:nuclear transcription factor Y subunit C-4-like [Daucus carota subsp. sativus]|uniref:nuclear transcription factor Y subunit C-4-like n=1 Tax=Daucus carota subsp. sativus TaxID=79200 RepID=UPI0030833F52
MYLKKHSLPLAPIKRIMKADNDIRMIAQEANLPLFAKPCEMFIVDMTSQAWIVTEEDKRRTVQKNDIVEAVLKTNMFDFLDNIIPRHELKERILKAKNARQRASSSTDSGTHGNNASNVTGAVVQQPPPFVPGHKPSSIYTFDILEHVIPRDESMKQILGATNNGQQASSSAATSSNYAFGISDGQRSRNSLCLPVPQTHYEQSPEQQPPQAEKQSDQPNDEELEEN